MLYVLGQRRAARTLLPVGAMTKDEVRAEADALGLRTADKPDSQDVCFVTSTAGRAGFLGAHPAAARPGGRRRRRPGRRVDAVELVTVGQRRGLGLPGAAAPALRGGRGRGVGHGPGGAAGELLSDRGALDQVVWADGPVAGAVGAQCSAHGEPRPPTSPSRPEATGSTVRFAAPRAGWRRASRSSCTGATRWSAGGSPRRTRVPL